MPDVGERRCGPCSLCCKVLRVDQLRKLGGVPCPELAPPGEGCGIHATRPGICRRYRCLWLQGHLDETDRPDRLGAVLDLVSEGGMPRLAIREAEPGAYDTSLRLQEIAARFRETMLVRITNQADVLDADASYRVLLPNGDEHRVEGEHTTILHPNGSVETARLPWIERGIRRAILAVRRLRLRSWARPVARPPAPTNR